MKIRPLQDRGGWDGHPDSRRDGDAEEGVADSRAAPLGVELENN